MGAITSKNLFYDLTRVGAGRAILESKNLFFSFFRLSYSGRREKVVLVYLHIFATLADSPLGCILHA